MIDILRVFWLRNIAVLSKPRRADAVENQVFGACVGDFLGSHRRNNHHITRGHIGWFQCSDGDFALPVCDYVDFLHFFEVVGHGCYTWFYGCTRNRYVFAAVVFSYAATFRG